MLTRRVAHATRVSVICSLVGLFNINNAVAQSVPAPWNAQDIGSPAIPGSAAFDQNRFTVTAAGKDISGRSDQFYFVYQQVTGNLDVVARIDSVSLAQTWSKAGVMIRSSLAADASHGFVSVSAGRGIAFQARANAGATTSSVSGEGAPPRWVRLIRGGTTLTAYTSVDGQTWTLISSSTISIGATAYVGLATTSSTSFRLGAYSIHAGGTDIGDVADQFHFVYQQMSGDVEIVARVGSLTLADPGTKSGVMIRESLAAGSRHGYAGLSAGNGYLFDRRADMGGLTDHTAGPSGVPPGWVRLVRTGSQIEAFRSQDGTNWRSASGGAQSLAERDWTSVAKRALLWSFQRPAGFRGQQAL